MGYFSNDRQQRAMEEARLSDEPPEDWYCHRCSEVVHLGARCRICGQTERQNLNGDDGT